MIFKTFIAIMKTQTRTIIKWFIICFCIVLPFTFIPIVLKHGISPSFLVERIPVSSLYALGFSVFIVIMAMANDYKSYSQRIRLLQKPAFADLDFQSGISGLDTGLESLDAFIIGKVNRYFFRLNIIITEETNTEVEIVPVIDIDKNPDLKALLEQQYGFSDRCFFGLIIEVIDEDLNNGTFLKEKLDYLAQEFEKINVEPIDISEKFKKSKMHF